MYRLKLVVPLFIALLFATVGTVATPPESASAQGRMREVGGYGLITANTQTFNYGSLDSYVNGSLPQGRIVFLNGWQIGVYHVGDYQWVPQWNVQPIIDANGNPMVNYVTRSGNQYYMNGSAISLPGRRITDAERFLANPGSYPVIYNGSYVPEDQPAELVNTAAVSYTPGSRVVATMRVTDLYDWIYLRTGPGWDYSRASYNAYAGEILTAYEVSGSWYRIGTNVWAPRSWNNEVYLVPENVAAYAPPEYYNGGKWISLDLNRQRLTAWEGSDVAVSSPIKTGKYGYSTPTGTFRTFSKVPNERMSGSDYDLKDVSWTQYFTSSGIALHTAYWHNNYNGRPGSHGCVNMPQQQARDVFLWAPLGIKIVSHNPYVYDQIDIQNAQQWEEYER
ncbi:MAG: L,D-transpeptidase [Ardenticatenales bacterium]|nr:L,D-transpeptidase [Ardenticatenales bacterium]